MMMRTRGFTLRDLLVVILVIVILAIFVSLLIPGTSIARELANQAKCRANLSYIGKAFTMYADEENGRFPLLWTTGQPEADIATGDSAVTIEELSTELAGKEAAMQNVWLLIDRGLVAEDGFQCPSDEGYLPRDFTDPPDRMANRVGWRSSANFSYGLHFPYKQAPFDTDPSSSQSIDNPAYIGPHLRGSFVIMADENPSQSNEPATGVGPNKTPSNHENDGEAYLMYSGHVNWKQSTKNSNINGEDIYTIQTHDNANPATPADLDDQYIVRHPALPKE